MQVLYFQLVLLSRTLLQGFHSIPFVFITPHISLNGHSNGKTFLSNFVSGLNV